MRRAYHVRVAVDLTPRPWWALRWRPWRATITHGVGIIGDTYGPAHWYARSQHDLEDKCRRWITRNSLRHGDPSPEIVFTGPAVIWPDIAATDRDGARDTRLVHLLCDLVAERRISVADAQYLNAVEIERDQLLAAIREHQATINTAGPVRVADSDSGDRATRKHQADTALWAHAPLEVNTLGRLGPIDQGVDMRDRGTL